jgi:hypothetical protein
MKPSKRFRQAFIVTAVPVLILVRLTLSYLQPGPASFFIKIIISGLAGLLLTYRHVWKILQSIFTKRSSGRSAGESRDE